MDDAEAKHDLWSITGDFIYRHNVEPRVKLYVLREESFPMPIKCIDVTRTTRTSPDAFLENNIDDYWNVDGERELSDARTGPHKIYFVERNSSKRIFVVRGRLTRNQTTSRYLLH